MPVVSSKVHGLRCASVGERRAIVARSAGLTAPEAERAVEDGGLSAEVADKFVENVIGTYALPLGVCSNVQVNGDEFLVPMVTEEPSVVAAASSAAKVVREGGGFLAEADAPVMIAQIQIDSVADPLAGAAALREASGELLELGRRALPALLERGGGPVGLEVRDVGGGMLVVHVHVDCRDAMGANLVNTLAEAIGERVAELGGGRLGLRILSNLCDKRLVRVWCRVPAAALRTGGWSGREVVERMAAASRFAEADPYRAATHNKGLMNGVDAVVMATGNDWRAVEAGAHAYAARSGRYAPLATFRSVDDGAFLEARLELPMALGTVGGTLRVHPAARLSLSLLGVSSAQHLGMVAASVGLASNFAAVRALATDGIQRGHMALHARALALTCGASAAEVDVVAAAMVEAREITTSGAERALRVLRATAASPSEEVASWRP